MLKKTRTHSINSDDGCIQAWTAYQKTTFRTSYFSYSSIWWMNNLGHSWYSSPNLTMNRFFVRSLRFYHCTPSEPNRRRRASPRYLNICPQDYLHPHDLFLKQHCHGVSQGRLTPRTVMAHHLRAEGRHSFYDEIWKCPLTPHAPHVPVLQ